MSRAVTAALTARLPVYSKRRPNESLLGFCIRVAEDNGVGNPLHVAWDAGIDISTVEAIATKPVDLTGLAELTGHPLTRLVLMSYRQIAATKCVNFLGHPLPKELVTVSHRRVCPECLTQERYHRAIWDLTISTVCHVHCRRLLTHCPNCREKLGWTRALVTHCRCGQDLRRFRSDRVPKRECTGLAIIADRLEGIQPRHPIHRQLRLMEPGGLAQMLLYMGWFGTGAIKRPRPIKLLSEGVGIHQLVNNGFSACSDLPQSMWAYLDRLAATKGHRQGRWGIVKTFGPLSSWILSSDMPGDARVFLQNYLSDYMALRGSDETRAKGIHRQTRATVTLIKAARLLGKSQTRVRRILGGKGLLSHDGGGKGAPAKIKSDVVQRLKSELTDLVDRTGARKHLRCSKAAYQVLICSGLIKSADGVAADLFGHQCWSTADLKVVLLELEEQAHRPPASNSISLSRFLAGLASLPGSEAKAKIRAALATSWIDPTKVGLERIRVCRPGRALPNDLVTVPIASLELRLKQEVTYKLCNRRLLKTCRLAGWRGRFVRRDDMKDFRMRYLVPSQLGLDRKPNRYPGWTSDQLLSAGLQPVSGPRIDGSRQYIFRRSEAIRILGPYLKG
jgi:hypothetical protein